MKSKLLIFPLLLCSVSLFSQSLKLKSETSDHVTFTLEFTPETPHWINWNGRNYLDYSTSYSVVTNDPGAPALPVFHTTIQLPVTGNPRVTVEYDSYEESDQVVVLPSKGSLKRNVDPATIPYTFGEVYTQNTFFPSELAQLNEPFIWRSMRAVNVTMYPIQYNPVTGKIRTYRNLRLKVSFNSQETGPNELQKKIKDPVMNTVQQAMVLNPELEKYTPKEETGSMLVIVDPAYSDEIQPLVDWKNQKGIRTELITTAVAGANDVDLLTYIQGYYSTHPELTFLLLVGDHAQVPAHTYGMSGGENLYSDSYYGQLAGSDYYPEVLVGRFSGTETDVITMVNRTLEYEKTPAPGSWMTHAIGLGSNQGDGIGDDGEPDWQHLRNIRTKLMDYGYQDISEFYDGSHGGEDANGDPTASMILPVVSGGIGLFNYTGHGDVNLCVSGNFQSTHVNQATNNGMYPLVVSVACSNGTFTNGTCISEAWLRATNNGSPSGAIAAAGSSILMAWAEPMQTQDEMTELIAETYPTNHKTLIGGLFYNAQMSMLENYPQGSGVEVMQTWILFGDPSAQFRNKETMDLNLSAPGNVGQNETVITVGCDVDGALVAISQSNVLLGTTYASGGTASVTIPTLVTNDYLIVTATRQNYATRQSVIQVGNGPLGLEEQNLNTRVYPNPANDWVTVQTTLQAASMTYRLIAPDGKTMRSGTLTVEHTGVSLQGLSQGTYLLELTTDDKIERIPLIKR